MSWSKKGKKTYSSTRRLWKSSERFNQESLFYLAVPIAVLAVVGLLAMPNRLAIGLILVLGVFATLRFYEPLAFLLPITSFLIEVNFFPTDYSKLEFHTIIAFSCVPKLLVITKRNIPKFRYFFFIGALGVMAIPSIVHFDDLQVIITFAKWIAAIAFGLAVFSTANNRKVLDLIVNFTIAVGVLVSVGGFLQILGLTNIWISPSFARDLPDSTLGYYSNFAAYCATTLLLAIGRIMYAPSRNIIHTTFLTFAAIVSGLAVALSLSRGAFIVTITGLVVLALNSLLRLRRASAAVSVLVLLAIASFILIPTTIFNEYANRFLTFQSGDIVRAQLQSAGAGLIFQYPFGVGLLQFSEIVSANGLLAERALAHCHNTYIQLGLDFGWIGLVALVWLVARIGIQVIAKRRLSETLYLTAPLAGLLFQATQDYMLYELPNLFHFALLVGANLGLTRISDIRHTETNVFPPRS